MSEMIVRVIMFLIVLSICGGIVVMLSRRGHFSLSSSVSDKDNIRVVSMRSLGGRKLLVAIEHMKTHFLIIVTQDDVKKIAEWPVVSNE